MANGIVFALDEEKLVRQFGITPNEAYSKIADFLLCLGLNPYGLNCYIGKNCNSVQCVLAVQKMKKEFIWFHHCIVKIDLLQLSEISDLLDCIR